MDLCGVEGFHTSTHMFDSFRRSCRYWANYKDGTRKTVCDSEKFETTVYHTGNTNQKEFITKNSVDFVRHGKSSR